MKRLRKPRLRAQDLRAARDSVLRAVSLVVTDRRWAAPLSAMALGFGLFLGVAIGPGAAGTFATGAGNVIAVAAPGREEEGEPETAVSAEPEAPAAEPEPEAFAVEPEPFEPAFSEPEPFEPAPVAEPAPEEEVPPAEPPTEEEAEEEGEAQLLRGAVVHANPAAESYTLAIDGGELVSVHAAKLPLPGEKLTVEGSPLPNNTFAEEERERAGVASKTELRGVVTYVDPDPADPVYTLSGRGSSLLVHLPPSPAPELPALGAYATVGVAIEKPAPAPEPAAAPAEPEAVEACTPDPALTPAPAPERIVVQRTLKAEPEPATYFDLAGIVSAVCPATKQLLISADDLRASEDDLLLTVPDQLQTGKLKVGESIVATATVEEDGTLTLAGLASDEGRKGAETPSLAQGDLKR